MGHTSRITKCHFYLFSTNSSILEGPKEGTRSWHFCCVAYFEGSPPPCPAPSPPSPPPFQATLCSAKTPNSRPGLPPIGGRRQFALWQFALPNPFPVGRRVSEAASAGGALQGIPALVDTSSPRLPSSTVGVWHGVARSLAGGGGAK